MDALYQEEIPVNKPHSVTSYEL